MIKKKKIIYSKNIQDIDIIKKHLSFNNKLNLSQTKRINSMYNKLKNRKKCIICNTKIKFKDFVNHKVAYSLCRNCGHLNGLKILNKNFNNKIYLNNNGKNYSKLYNKFYLSRVKKIYEPKVIFLKSVIKNKFQVLDFGCGGGHAVKSCENLGVKAIGLDPNKELIKFGNKYLRKNQILSLSFDDCLNYIESSNADVLSLFFVLEHLEKPLQIFEKFKRSKIKYLYFSVPLFNLSVLIENIFKNVYPRQLGGYHTNLFSYDSINFISKKFNLKIIGEWWFGSDISDLKRSLFLSSDLKTDFIKEKFNLLFSRNINELQNILDRSKNSSEVHIIMQKN